MKSNVKKGDANTKSLYKGIVLAPKLYSFYNEKSQNQNDSSISTRVKLGLEPCHPLLPLVSFLIYYATSSGMSDSYMAMKYKIMYDIKRRVQQNNFLLYNHHLLHDEKLEFFILSKYLLEHFSILLIFQVCICWCMMPDPKENSWNTFKNILKISYTLPDTWLLLIWLTMDFHYIFTYEWIEADSTFDFQIIFAILCYLGLIT